MPFCEHCGHNAGITAKFCPECGTRLSSVRSGAVSATIKVEQTSESGTIVDCARCNGTGTYYNDFWGTKSVCTVCEGKGKVRL